MSLRDQIIEAAADELERLADLRVGVGMKFAAESVLTAMLDVLEAEAEDWWYRAGDVANRDPLRGSYDTWAGDLIDVLRDSVGVEVEKVT